jgi:hypothetical protein
MEVRMMPFIKVEVSRPVSADQEVVLKSRLGKAIELAPEKERWASAA